MATRSELELKLDEIAGKLKIGRDVWENAKDEWIRIYRHHEETGEHCARSAEIGARMGEYFQGRRIYPMIKPNAFFLGGLLHDDGKIGSNPLVLNKSAEEFDEADMEHMRRHPLEGYKRLRARFPLIAEIALNHHENQANGYGYPEDLPEPEVSCSSAEDYVKEVCIFWVSVIDKYDAMTTRIRRGRKNPLSKEEAVAELQKMYPNQGELIRELYGEMVF